MFGFFLKLTIAIICMVRSYSLIILANGKISLRQSPYFLGINFRYIFPVSFLVGALLLFSK